MAKMPPSAKSSDTANAIEDGRSLEIGIRWT